MKTVGSRRGLGWAPALVLRAAVGMAMAVVVMAGGADTTGSEPGPAAQQHMLRVVGLGDSVTAGTACDCDDFVRQFAGLAGRRIGQEVLAANDGVPGLTSSGLRDQLESGSDVSRDVRTGDVVMITIGANDLLAARRQWEQDSCDDQCAAADLPWIRRNIEQAVGDVRRLRDGQPTEILVTNYWNVFEDGAVARARQGPAFLSWSDHVTRMANSVICTAAARAGSTCVDLYAAFKGDGTNDPTPLLAADGDHPNAEGHQLIAATMAAQVPLPNALP